jgi:hypothetical protein
MNDCNDKKYESLEHLLKGMFYKDLHELHQRVEQENPLLWDFLSADQSHVWAEQADYHNNPANDE